MDDYTDTQLDTDNWTTLGIAALRVVDKSCRMVPTTRQSLATREETNVAGNLCRCLEHPLEYLAACEDREDQHNRKPRHADCACVWMLIDVIDFGFVVIIRMHLSLHWQRRVHPQCEQGELRDAAGRHYLAVFRSSMR